MIDKQFRTQVLFKILLNYSNLLPGLHFMRTLCTYPVGSSPMHGSDSRPGLRKGKGGNPTYSIVVVVVVAVAVIVVVVTNLHTVTQKHATQLTLVRIFARY